MYYTYGSVRAIPTYKVYQLYEILYYYIHVIVLLPTHLVVPSFM